MEIISPLTADAGGGDILGRIGRRLRREGKLPDQENSDLSDRVKNAICLFRIVNPFISRIALPICELTEEIGICHDAHIFHDSICHVHLYITAAGKEIDARGDCSTMPAVPGGTVECLLAIFSSPRKCIRSAASYSVIRIAKGTGLNLFLDDMTATIGAINLKFSDIECGGYQ